MEMYTDMYHTFANAKLRTLLEMNKLVKASKRRETKWGGQNTKLSRLPFAVIAYC